MIQHNPNRAIRKKGLLRLSRAQGPVLGALSVLGLFSLLSCISSLPPEIIPRSGTYQQMMDIRVDLFRRSYFLHVPDNYSGTEPLPLLVVLHGAFSTGREMEAFTGFKKFSLAPERNVKELTGYSIGGVPLFAVKDLMPVYVDSEVMKQNYLIGSGGNPYVGLKMNPKEFAKLGYTTEDIHLEDG